MAVDVKKTGMLLIISGPSGTGKGTLVQKLMESDPSFHFSCSVTTRAPRDGEIDGVHYHFVSEEEYQRLVSENAFLEHAKVHANFYGTLRKPVEEMMAEGKNVLLDIDTQGAVNVMSNAADYVSIFILPPSAQELRRRLVDRKSETPEQIEGRMVKSTEQMKTAYNYDYVVLNDDLEAAVQDVVHIICTVRRRTILHKELIDQINATFA